MEVYNNGGAADDEGINPSDDIYIACTSGISTASCTPAVLGPPDFLTWSFQMHVASFPSVLNGADIPAHPTTWQQLTSEGVLSVSFNDTIVRGFYGFSAKPISFRETPEPGFYSNVLFWIAVLLAPRRFL